MPIAFRKKQLIRLYDMIAENRQWIIDALKSDLGKPASETGLELEVYLSDVVHYLEHLDEYAADEKVSAHFPFNLDTNLIQKEPLGVVLNISPWNYPIVLTLNPLIAILAAGNTCVLKPSEIAPASSAVMQTLVTKYLDNRVVKVVQGGVAETTELLSQPFDHIIYTGNGTISTRWAWLT